MIKKRLASVFSNTVILLSIMIDLAFAIWAASGRVWYVYILYFGLLFVASGIVNASYIQGVTRAFSYVVLYGVRGISKALRIGLVNIMFILVAYVITRFVFSTGLQYIVFFAACIVLSTIVAFIDREFQVAIARTTMFESTKKNSQDEGADRKV